MMSDSATPSLHILCINKAAESNQDLTDLYLRHFNISVICSACHSIGYIHYLYSMLYVNVKHVNE